MLFFTFASIIVVFIFTYFIFNNDFFSPAMIFIESFLLAIIMSVVCFDKWETTYSVDFYLAVMLSLVTFVVVSFFTKITNKKIVFSNKFNIGNGEIVPIHIGRLFYFGLLVLCIISFLLYCSEVYKISLLLGNNRGVSGMFFVYHNSYLLAQGGSGIKMNSIVDIMSRMIMALGYYFAYVFCNNVFRFNERVVKNIKYLVFILIYALTLLAASQRTGIVYIIFTMLLMANIIIRQNMLWKKNDNNTIKIILFSFFIIVILAIGLRATGELMGRTTEQNVFAYFSGYLGGGIPNFSKFLNTHSIKLVGTCYGANDVGMFNSYSGIRCNLCTVLGDLAYMGWLPYWGYIIFISVAYSYLYYAYIYRKRITVACDYAMIIFGFSSKGLLFAGLTDIITRHIIGVSFFFVCGCIIILDIICRKNSLSRRSNNE